MYKFSNPEHTKVTHLTTGTTGIHPRIGLWQEYQKWLAAGGVTEAYDIRTAQKKKLDAQRETALRIEYEYDMRKKGGVQLAGVWYPSDFESMFMYLDWKDVARDMLAAGSVDTDTLLVDDNPALLESLDGVVATMRIKDVFSLVDKSRRLLRKLKKVRRDHLVAMKASATPETYDYTTNWPERYIQLAT